MLLEQIKAVEAERDALLDTEQTKASTPPPMLLGVHDGGANCEIKPSGDLDIWPDALRHVRDYRAQRRSRRALAKALSSVAHEHRIALWIGFGAFLEAWVELESPPAFVALLNMRRAAALLDSEGVGAFRPLVKASLAEAEARNGELKAALATLEEALDGFDRIGQRWFNAEIHRMRGEILLKLNPADPAPAHRVDRS